ncbi:MAG: radical SAM protein [bacterium]|nr:radical SAM protein [bacterium]
MQRREFLKTMASAGMCSMLCSSCSFSPDNIDKNVVGSKFLYKSKADLPTKINLEACSLCQLNCPACFIRLNEENIKKQEGFGYLRFKDFKKLVNDNPQIKEIELANHGEIFLNPELDKIIKYAYKKKITLTANLGVNMNTLSDEMAEILVKYKFSAMTVSIDGATPDVYKIYRRGGDLNKVIANVKKINEFKKKYNSEFPKMFYKFIIFNHNIDDILPAKKLAKELEMILFFVCNNQPSYAPLSAEQKIRAEKLSGIKLEDTGEKYLLENYKSKKSVWFPCQDLFLSPQIDWNGKLLGCCSSQISTFDVNVFEDGLLKALNHQNVLYAKQMVTDLSTPPKKEIFCSECYIYKALKEEKYEMFSDRKLI